MKEKLENKIIGFKKISDTKILFIFNDKTKRVFDIERMFNDDIPQGQQYRWKQLLKNNRLFDNLYISMGEPVWEGWTELINDEIYKYTYEI